MLCVTEGFGSTSIQNRPFIPSTQTLPFASYLRLAGDDTKRCMFFLGALLLSPQTMSMLRAFITVLPLA